jgi:sialate O-acetylesterase
MRPVSMALVSLLCLRSIGVRADVELAGIFGNHMVLQRGVSVPVWGKAAPGESVTVTFRGQSKESVADAAGRWKIELEALEASSEGSHLGVRGTNEIAFDDVVVGDVWYASGQSNMEMHVGAMADGLGDAGARFIREASFSGIRFRKIDDRDAPSPLEDLRSASPWVPCSPDSVTRFSAVAMAYARRLHAELEVPVGVIDGSWGGKPIESFIPRDAFVGHPVLERERELARLGDLAGLKRLEGGVFARDASWLPGAIHNSRVAPIAAFPIRGVIWYQGESNCGRGEDPRHYRVKMRALIGGWRRAWKSPDLPFYFVQLPGFEAAATGWPFLREEQRLSAAIRHCGMVVTIDLEGAGIHPPNKIDVGERLALWALARQHGRAIPSSGPLYSNHEARGGRIIVRFDPAFTGLMTGKKSGLEPVEETPGVPPTWFELADAKGKWHEARATIDGDTVIVESAAVPMPSAVRYAYDPVAKGANLYSRTGLPAAPFCSNPELLEWTSSEE